jgi:hypothetical protein
MRGNILAKDSPRHARGQNLDRAGVGFVSDKQLTVPPRKPAPPLPCLRGEELPESIDLIQAPELPFWREKRPGVFSVNYSHSALAVHIGE